MRVKKKSKIPALCVAICMLAAVITLTAEPAEAASGDPAMNLGSSVLSQNANANAGTQRLWYGQVYQWHVIGYGGCITLLATDVKQDVAFQTQEYIDEYGFKDGMEYNDSELKNVMNSLKYGGSNAILTRQEQDATVPKDISGEFSNDGNFFDTSTFISSNVSGYRCGNQTFWALTMEEALRLNDSLKFIGRQWWVSTPGRIGSGGMYYGSCVLPAANRGPNGNTYASWDYLYNFNVQVDPRSEYGLRPAFQLDPSRVIFTSAANGGKVSGASGHDALRAVGTNKTDEWTVTLRSGHESFVVEPSYQAGTKTLTLAYNGAVQEHNGYVSAIIVDKDDKIKYYGRIAKVTAPRGTASIGLADKMTGTDKLYVFDEQYNGSLETDYASELIPIPLSLDQDMPFLHELVKTDRIEPTGTSEGTEAYWTCTTCGRMYADPDGNIEIDEPVVIPMTLNVSVSPVKVDFGTVQEEYTGIEPKTIKIKNTGTSTLTLRKPSSGDFLIGELSADRLGRGKTATFTIEPKPLLQPGTHSETITVRSGSDDGSIVDIPVSITVTASVEQKSGFALISGSSGFEAQEPDKLVDGDTATKWCAAKSHQTDGMWQMEFQTEHPLIVESYVLTTGDDTATYKGRNPVSWRLYGKSSQSDEWTLLSKIDNDATLPLKNKESCRFAVSNDAGKAYQYYRFEVLQCRSGDTFQLSELSINALTNKTVTFNANGGTVDPETAVTGEGRKLAALPEPTRGKMLFTGWYTSAAGGTNVTVDTVFGSDSTIYAHWAKAANPMVVKNSAVSIRYSKLKKKSQTVPASKAYKVTSAQGTKSFKLTGVTASKYKKYFSVNGKNGNLTVKKGLKKGTYKVKVKITAAGNATYKSASKTATVTVKVK